MIPADTAAQVRNLLTPFAGAGIPSALEWSGCAGMEANPDVSWYAGMQTGTVDPIVVVAVMEGQPSQAVDVGRRILAKALSTG